MSKINIKWNHHILSGEDSQYDLHTYTHSMHTLADTYMSTYNCIQMMEYVNTFVLAEKFNVFPCVCARVYVCVHASARVWCKLYVTNWETMHKKRLRPHHLAFLRVQSVIWYICYHYWFQVLNQLEIQTTIPRISLISVCAIAVVSFRMPHHSVRYLLVLYVHNDIIMFCICVGFFCFFVCLFFCFFFLGGVGGLFFSGGGGVCCILFVLIIWLH